MDPVSDIKARLPIEELVGQYCQLQKKGRGFICLCPFHKDTHPSFLVSPDKGIGYCFACNSGGDIFSFYQKIEGVDFRQAIIDLADKAGVELPKESMAPTTNKDEKDRLRECLQAALKFYQEQFSNNTKVQDYLKGRSIPEGQWKEFGLGFAPDSYTETYEYLLKKGFSRTEIVNCSLGIQKDLQEGKIYDRFRNRLMIPIYDVRGQIVAFGGRTLGDDDAKYINSSEGPLYHKSQILYGLDKAKDSMRDTKTVVMVEGYFDVLACYRVGVQNVVAVSGTALTEQHVKILKRTCEKVVLCLDQDQAGQQAAEKAYLLCSKEGLLVNVATLEQKDPDEAANANPDALKVALGKDAKPYMEYLLDKVREFDTTSAEAKRLALQRILPLLDAIQTSVERSHYITLAAAALGTTETALQDDIRNLPKETAPEVAPQQNVLPPSSVDFNKIEITLGLFMFYPKHRELIKNIIEPADPFCAELFRAIDEAPDTETWTLEQLDIAEEYREKAAVLLLFCEEHNMHNWSDSLARQELKKNCNYANKLLIKDKLKDITNKMFIAQKEGKKGEQEQLSNQYQELLKLARMSE